MAMMVGYDEIVAMLRGACRQIQENHELLGRLDSVGGDGDHGPTMLRVMTTLEKAIAASAARDIKKLLKDGGWAVMGVDGGATGPLLGSLFMGMSDAVAPEAAELVAAALAALFAAGLAKVRKQTKAQPGDKTMIDALVPGVEAIQAAAASGAAIPALLEAGAAAAARGAEATTAMMAKFGRARNIKEKSIGSPDAGATSTSLIFKGFMEGVTANA
jgi:dihydroxyacetone kinase-like protein